MIKNHATTDETPRLAALFIGLFLLQLGSAVTAVALPVFVLDR